MGTCWIAQGTLVRALWWPKWERNPKQKGCVYTYSRFSLLWSRKWHNIVKQLYATKDFKNKSRMYIFIYIYKHTERFIVRNWLTQLTKAEKSQDLNSPFLSLSVQFRSSVDWMRPVHNRKALLSAERLLSLPIPVSSSSRNNLTDTPKTMFNQMSTSLDNLSPNQLNLAPKFSRYTLNWLITQ